MQPYKVLTGLEYNSLAGLCVYAWIRGETYLYVGTSGNGLARALKHNIVGKAEDVQDGDSIAVWVGFADWESAQAFETALNSERKPKFSRIDNDKNERPCPVCGTVFKPKRKWQKFCSVRCKT